jgi:hypothetical protein
LGARINAIYSMTDTDFSEPCVRADHCYGLFTHHSGEEKPLLRAMAELVTALKGFAFKERIAQASESTYVLAFASPTGEMKYAVWESVAPDPVTVILPNGAQVQATGKPVFQ